VAVRVHGGSGTLNYTYNDHLGSITVLSNYSGNYTANSLALYEPYGAYRATPPVTNPDITNHGFTGHRHNNTGSNAMALIYMNARYYLLETGRFISADTLVPDPHNPQSYNRYSYVENRPSYSPSTNTCSAGTHPSCPVARRHSSQP
jgi:RHS repeat-associated protein